MQNSLKKSASGGRVHQWGPNKGGGREEGVMEEGGRRSEGREGKEKGGTAVIRIKYLKHIQC